MKHRLLVLNFILLTGLFVYFSFIQLLTPAYAETIPKTVFIFYYPWYTAPPFDSSYGHWNGGDSMRPNQADNITSSYFPLLGAYDSRDERVISQHMQWLKQAGINVIVISWWGKNSFEDSVVPLILNAAQTADLKVSFMIEPYNNRTEQSVIDDIKYIYSTYGSYSSFFHVTKTTRFSNRQSRGVFFIYNSTASSSWKDLFNNLRGTPNDGIFLMDVDDQALLDKNYANYVINTTGSDGLFNYGQYDKNSAYNRTLPIILDSLLVYAASPGFDDTRIRMPGIVVDRKKGNYYDDSWINLVAQDVEAVSIVSFNEWHEGTQIEPAQTKTYNSFTYKDYTQDYGSSSPLAYINRTSYWVNQYKGVLTTPTPAIRNGDLNHNGIVDIFDYSMMVSMFGKSGNLEED